MDAIDQLQQDVRDGKIDVDRLVDLLILSQRQLEATRRELETTRRELEAAQQQIEELNKRIAGSTTSAKVDQPFSLRAEEQRQQQRGRKKRPRSQKGRRGRLTTADKLKLALRTESCFPASVAKEDCRLSHTRPVWCLENGRAVLIAYAIYRGPNDRYGHIPGVLGRSEFSLDIVVEIAYFVYVMGLSFDKVCHLLQFVQQLPLKKTQVDSLLRQLARHWQHEFDVLCTLLANSLVVHADETSWSIHSVWAFLSEKARLLFYGVHKDADTLEKILDPGTFGGLLISDDAAVYANFTQAQKCWAHILRKAIKLTLQAPDNLEYRHCADALLEIYRKACRVQRDRRLSEAGRARKVVDLEEDIFALCGVLWAQELPPLEGLANDYRLLVNEAMRLMTTEQLFTFVTTPAASQPNGHRPAVAGTNNESERTLRHVAGARETGRTNKTVKGARRQTIIVSVLESLRLYLVTFTLTEVMSEIQCWWQTGQSCFTRLLTKLKLPSPKESILDQLLPVPDG